MSDFEAVVRWYLVLAAAASVGLPIGMFVFGNAWCRAPWFARPIGMLAVLFPTWYLSSATSIPYSTTGLLITTAFLAIAGWLLVIRRFSLDRRFLTNLAMAEVATLISFLGALWLRGFTPDILNTEKPMDAAFLSSSIRAVSMPPPDPWMAGETINYYYLGYALHGAIARMAGITTGQAFNLALITTTAMVIVAVMGAALVSLPRWGKIAAPLSAFLVVISGNMVGPYDLLRDGRAAWDADWWRGMGWNASRVVYDGKIQTINEFPSFSIILGDLHPHLSALPFAVVALALSISIARQPSILTYPQIVGAGWISGALYALNSWDLPTYFGLIALAVLWNLRRTGLRKILIGLAVLCATALIAWAPFLVHFTPPLAADESVVPPAFRNVPIISSIFMIIGSTHQWDYTSAGEFLKVFGLPYALICLSLIVAARRFPAEAQKSQVMRPIGIAVVIFLLIALLANAPVVIFVGIPGALAAWLLSRYSINRTEGLLGALFLAGGFLLLITEFFFIHDNFDTRMNTLFKVYYQVWLLWGLGAGLSLAWLIGTSKRMFGRTTLVLVATGAIVLGLVYPVTSSYRWSLEFAEWRGLDGLAYVGDMSADELAGIHWIEANAGANSTLLEAPGCSYQPISRIPFDHVSAFTGVPTVMGWFGSHEALWRSGDQSLANDIRPRIDEAQGFFNAPSVEFLDKYGIDFVYYGIYEQGEGQSNACEMAGPLPRPDDQWMSDHGFAIGFQQGDVTIWQRTDSSS